MPPAVERVRSGMVDQRKYESREPGILVEQGMNPQRRRGASFGILYAEDEARRSQYGNHRSGEAPRTAAGCGRSPQQWQPTRSKVPCHGAPVGRVAPLQNHAEHTRSAPRGWRGLALDQKRSPFGRTQYFCRADLPCTDNRRSTPFSRFSTAVSGSR